MPPHGVMFHHFHDDFHAVGQGSIGAGDLLRLIDFVGRSRILPAGEWLDRATRNALREGDLCLTFDDTLLCQYDVAVPLLRDLRLTAFFFVSTAVLLPGHVDSVEVYRHFRSTAFRSVEQFYGAFDAALDAGPHVQRVRQGLLRFNPREYLAEFPFYSNADRRFRFLRDEVLGPDAYRDTMDRMLDAFGIDVPAVARRLWMTADHLRTLHVEGHVIGLHSHSHPTRLARMSPQQQRDEYAANHRAVRQVTGSTPVAMSHPCNSYSPYTLAILRQLGIRVGFRANMVQASYCPLEHPREDHSNLLARMQATLPLARPAGAAPVAAAA